MDLMALSSRLARRWWLVAGLAAVAALGAVTAGAAESDEHRTKLEFVLRPDASVTSDDLPGTLEALKSDGTLVQTVIGVLGNRVLLRRAATEAGVTLTPAYTVDATAQPGSTLIDSTLSGTDRSVVDRLAAAYAREASIYVASSYSAYVLERLSTEAVSTDSGPGTGQVAIVALLLGGALGVLLVAAELRLGPQLQRLAAARGRSEPTAAEPEREPEPAPTPPPGAGRSRARQSRWRESNGAPERGQPSHPAARRPGRIHDEDED
jgi:hypothetical protein